MKIKQGSLTELGYAGLSDYRKSQLKDSEYHVPSVPSAGNVISSSRVKTASIDASVGGGYRGAGDTVAQSPYAYSPLTLMSNMDLPRDRASVNAWCRAYMALNPVVQNAIMLHSTYPISKLNIKCKNKKVNDFFEVMIDELDLMNVCVQMAQEYWTLGEVFPYAVLDEDAKKWSRISIQNPDYVEVSRSVVGGESRLSLKPDDNLRKICMSNKPADIEQRRSLDPAIVDIVRKGQNIPLNNFYASHLSRKIAPYEARGTSIIVSCFKSLMLLDKLKENKYVQADDMINGITLVKIGGGSDAYKPTPEDLERWRQVFENATYNKDFKLITHDGIAIEKIGSSGALVDIAPDVAQAFKEIYAGLFVPAVLIEGGDSTTYATASVTLDVLKQRYMTFRNILSNWLRRKIFAPISKLNKFYETIDGEDVLIVPEVEWNHMSLFDAGDYINVLKELATNEQKIVSKQTLYRSLGLDYDDEKRKVRRENIDSVITAKEMESLQKMDLNALRALTDEEEIREIDDGEGNDNTPLPGEETPDGGMGGLGGLGDLGGGPPDMEAPPGPPPTEGM